MILLNAFCMNPLLQGDDIEVDLYGLKFFDKGFLRYACGPGFSKTEVGSVEIRLLEVLKDVV
jgi:hypothetical protein